MSGSRSFLSRLAGGSFWSAAGLAATRGVTTFALMIASQVLGPAAFGILTLVQMVGGTAGTTIGYGLSTASTKRISESEPEEAGRLALACEQAAVRWGLRLAGLVAAAAAMSWAVGLCDTSTAFCVSGAAPFAMLTTLQLTQLGIFASLEAFRRQAVTSVIGSSIGAMILLAMVWSLGTAGAIAGLLLLVSVQTVLLGRSMRAELRERRVPVDAAASVSLRAVGVPAALSSVATSGGLLAGIAILKAHSDGFSGLGLFGAANQWFTLLMFLPMTLANVLFPLIVEAGDISSAGAGRRRFLGGFGIIAVMAALPAVVALLLIDPIVSFYGPKYADSGFREVLRLTLLTVMTTAVLRPAYLGLTARSWLRPMPYVSAACALILVAAAWLWRTDGAAGLAAARLASSVAHVVFTLLVLGMAVRGTTGDQNEPPRTVTEKTPFRSAA